MAKGPIRSLIQLFRQSFEGPAWHGQALQELLEEMDPELAGVRCNGSHSPLELLLHIAIWRNYVIRMMRGETHMATEEELTFPSVAVPGEYSWTDARVKLDKSQRELTEELEKFPEDQLEKVVPGRDYTWNEIFHFLLQHDAYHLGQMRLLTKHLSA